MATASPSAELAQSILVSLGLWRLPVDPFEVAKREGIFLAEDDYPDGFDARIEYFPNGNKFGIFYASAGVWRTPGRVRFSIGHELGHYYLPEHRAIIRSGKNHNSESDYSSRNPMEQQADYSSADLLMPIPLFRDELNFFRERLLHARRPGAARRAARHVAHEHGGADIARPTGSRARSSSRRTA